MLRVGHFNFPVAPVSGTGNRFRVWLYVHGHREYFLPYNEQAVMLPERKEREKKGVIA